MARDPHENIEEKLKRVFVPPRLYIEYLYRKNLRKGERELRLLPFLAQKDRVSIDVGANKGVYSFALLQNSSGVVAYEPNPKLYRILHSWGEGKIDARPFACGQVPGKAVMRLPKGSHGYSNQGGSLNEAAHEGKETLEIEVEVVRLDDAGIQGVGFIKIDVEGFELDVLRGATEILKRDRPNMLIEIEERHTGKRLADMIPEVCGYGYECLALMPQGLRRITDWDNFDGIGINNFIFVPARSC